MASSLVIEEQTGTSRGWVHAHNGYYAGDFSAADGPIPSQWPDAASRAGAGPRMSPASSRVITEAA